MLTITLNQIRKHGPCLAGWERLLTSLGKTHADNEPFSFEHILDSNGLDDALWALQCVDPTISRLLTVAFAQDVIHLMQDKRGREAVKVAHLYAHGETNNDELDAARYAAWAAAWAAAQDAQAAARSAAWDAAQAAAQDAAWAAARDAARQKQIDHVRALCRAWGDGE